MKQKVKNYFTYGKNPKSDFQITNIRKKINSSVFDVSNLEIQLQKTSNNTYLKLFDLESPLFGDSGSSEVSTLNSFVNLTANSEDLDIDASFEVYEKLDKSNKNIFPLLEKGFTSLDILKGIKERYEDYHKMKL